MPATHTPTLTCRMPPCVPLHAAVCSPPRAVRAADEAREQAWTAQRRRELKYERKVLRSTVQVRIPGTGACLACREPA